MSASGEAAPAGVRTGVLGYDPALDGVRAVAIMLVVGHHSPWGHSFPFNHGWVGVDVFFVLSGYLITTLLLREQERTGTVDLSQFYWRRFLRLMPVLWMWLGVLWCLGSEENSAIIATLLYVANFALILGFMSTSSHMALCWSLAIEEQFYLAWPPIVKAVGPKRLLSLALWTILAVMLWRVTLIANGVNGFPYLNVRPDARMDTLLWGCAAALVERRAWFPRVREAVVENQTLLLGGLLLVGFLSFRMSELGGAYTGQLGFTITAMTTAGVILWMRSCPGAGFTRLMGISFLALIGRLSYSIYLWHELAVQKLFGPAVSTLGQLVGPSAAPLPRWAFAGGGAVVWCTVILGTALASHYFVERPFLLLKNRPVFGKSIGRGVPSSCV